MTYPATRLRRLRVTPALRRMVSETSLGAGRPDLSDVRRARRGDRRPIASMPGICQLGGRGRDGGGRAVALGVPAVLLFGVPANKDATGSENYADDGIVQQATRALKAVHRLVVIVDLCLCEYTDHGHCGVIPRAGSTTMRRLRSWVAPRELCARRRPDRTLGHDGRHGRRHSRCAGPRWPRRPASSATRSSMPGAFYGPFRDAAEGARRSSATARRTRWIRRTCARRCASWRWTSRRARPGDGQARAGLPGRRPPRAKRAICPWRHTTSAASTQCSRRPRRTGGSTSAPRCWNCSRASARADLIVTYHALDAAGWLRSSLHRGPAGAALLGRTADHSERQKPNEHSSI